MKLFLPDHVHAVAIDADAVFLDTTADVYFCLAGAGALMTIGLDGLVGVREPEAAAPLVEAGLLVVGGAARAPTLPPAATTGLAMHGRPMTPTRLVKALHANADAAKAVAQLTFADILGLARHGRAASAVAEPLPLNSHAVLSEAARFARFAPWLPRGGVCLMRSLQQLLYLRGLGYAPTWVFGVRTWPFQAHCWLQADTVVLDDHVEHVRAFAPILAV
jgi:hypothetical protein